MRACLFLVFVAVSDGFAPGPLRTRPLGSACVARHAQAPQTQLGAARHNATTCSRKSRLAARAGRALSRRLPRLRSARLLARRAGSVLVYAAAALTVGSYGVQPVAHRRLVDERLINVLNKLLPAIKIALKPFKCSTSNTVAFKLFEENLMVNSVKSF